VYLQVADRPAYVPATLAEAARSRVEISRRLRKVLREISAINLELLPVAHADAAPCPEEGPLYGALRDAQQTAAV